MYLIFFKEFFHILMFYADTIGLPEVYRRILEFETKHGELWEPAPLLKKLASEGKTFMQWAKESVVSW